MMLVNYVMTDSCISINNSQEECGSESEKYVPCFTVGADQEGVYLKGKPTKRGREIFEERRIDFLGSNKYSTNFQRIMTIHIFSVSIQCPQL